MHPRLAIPLFFSKKYASRVLATFPIAYWKQGEGTGTDIIDSSGNGYDGTYTGVTWDGTQSPFSGPVPYYDGDNDFGDVYSDGFSSAFDLAEFTILIWGKVAASVWTDGSTHYALRFVRDANNNVQIYKPSNNRMIFSREGNSVVSSVDLIDAALFSGTNWFSFAISASEDADEVKAYVNGSQIGATQSSLGASAGSGLLDTLVSLGSANSTPTGGWDGYLSHAIVWDSPMTPDKLALMRT